MKDVYIFDLDGTLIDSMRIFIGIVLGYLDEKGISYPDDLVKRLTPLGYKGSAKYIAEQLCDGCSVESIYGLFEAKTLQAYGESIPLKANVEVTLRKLHETGASLNVLTASPKRLTDICLKRLQVFDLFENVWSIDDFGLTKAQPQIYQEAAKRLGVALTDCVMVDDNLEVLKVAKSVGMKTIGVFDESSKEYQEEMRELADGYVVDLADILK